MEHIDKLKLKIRRYEDDFIFEFDEQYVNHFGSAIMKKVVVELECEEKDIRDIIPVKNSTGEVEAFYFSVRNSRYIYEYKTERLKEVNKKADKIIIQEYIFD